MGNMGLKKLIGRVKSDKIISFFSAAVFACFALYHLFKVVVAIKGGDIGNEYMVDYASLFVKLSCLAVSQLLLGLILQEITKGGKPFNNRNVKKIRWMAIVLIASWPIQIIVSVILTAMNPMTNGILIQIGFNDIVLSLFGAIIGIISEIFFYGKEIEDEIDTIA